MRVTKIKTACAPFEGRSDFIHIIIVARWVVHLLHRGAASRL
jgi:hypothetical protein